MCGTGALGFDGRLPVQRVRTPATGTSPDLGGSQTHAAATAHVVAGAAMAAGDVLALQHSRTPTSSTTTAPAGQPLRLGRAARAGDDALRRTARGRVTVESRASRATRSRPGRAGGAAPGPLRRRDGTDPAARSRWMLRFTDGLLVEMWTVDGPGAGPAGDTVLPGRAPCRPRRISLSAGRRRRPSRVDVGRGPLPRTPPPASRVTGPGAPASSRSSTRVDRLDVTGRGGQEHLVGLVQRRHRHVRARPRRSTPAPAPGSPRPGSPRTAAG